MLGTITATTPVALQAAIVGFIFGFLLQKGGIAQFNVIVGQLLLKNFRMLKIMMTAILVGGVLVYGTLSLNLAQELLVGPFSLAAVIVGSALVGLGMAVLGYCPGTAVAAAGQGSRDAYLGIIGLVIGSGIYAFTYPILKNSLLNIWLYPAKITLATLLGISPWTIFIILIVGTVVGFAILEKWEL